MSGFIMAAKQLMIPSDKDEAACVNELLKVVTNMASGFPNPETVVTETAVTGEQEELDTFCASVMSPQVDMTATTASSKAGSYLEVAKASVDARLVQLGATMPYLYMRFVRKGKPDESQTRRGYLDTGANLSFISGRAFKRDRKLWGPKVEIHEVKGSPVTLADGMNHGRIEAVVKGLQVCIGTAVYELDCVVMEPCGVDYLLGFGFFNTWHATLRPNVAKVTLGVERAASLLPSDQYQSYQHVPVKYDFKEFSFPTNPKAKTQ